MPDLTDAQAAEIRALLFAGNKIAAIKLCRDRAGLGLAEAKTLIDQLETTLRTQHPEKFSTPKNGCASRAALLGLFLLAALCCLLR